MLTLPFNAVPGNTRLFTDYCNGGSDARKFFVGHYSDPLAYETHVQILAGRAYFRLELSRVLTEQNRRFGSSPIASANITRLTEPTTFCVLTGQQTGLLTGPLYTIYKALTAKRLAAWLTDRFPGFAFIPVFWLEADDHDLDEAGRLGVISAENDLVNINYHEPAEDEPRNVLPVGAMPLDDRIENVFARLEAALPKTDFTADTLETARSAWRPGVTFAEAFARMFNSLFPESGIVFTDSSDPKLKKLLTPVILQELETWPASGEEVIKRSAELEQRYHAQVKPRAVNLFFLHKGGRYPVEPSEYGFFLRGSRQRYTKEELLEIADNNPEFFSPNVLLRPIFQDFLFPTAAIVAGPAEVAYFAQLQPVYDHFRIPMPVIFPRASITIVEQKIRKLFNKFELSYAGMFEPPEELYRSLPASHDTDGDAAAFERIKAEIEAALSRLPDIGAKHMPRLSGPAGDTAANIRRYLSMFEERLLQARRERDTVVQRQLEKMNVYLAPGGKAQELVLNIVTYLNRYGRGLLPQIEEFCVPFPAEHRLLLL